MLTSEVTVETFVPKKKVPPAFTKLTDLLSERVGGKVLGCSDEFFAAAENLVKAKPPIFIPDKFTDNGKWMDGWETRRKRKGPNDWCILKLGIVGQIVGVDINTEFFRGNCPPFASLEAVSCKDDVTLEELKSMKWTTIVEKSEIDPGTNNFFEVKSEQNWTHLRLQIYPDGGVARLRVYGKPKGLVYDKSKANEIVDLVSMLNGGRGLICSDQFFSSMQNLLLPGDAINMGDGWETKRRRGPGFDWIIIKMGCDVGYIRKVVVYTHHFKGNYPESFSLQVSYQKDLKGVEYSVDWTEVIPKTPLSAHAEHVFEIDSKFHKLPCNLVKLNIYPDGGISRLRVYGLVAPPQ